MRRCDKHGHDRLPDFLCPACVLDERNRLQAENEALRHVIAAYERNLMDGDGEDRSQDTDWLRAGFLQRGTELERLEAERDDHEQARTALEEVVGQLRAEADELREALLELYRWCNNVEIRGEGLHQGPIFFAGPVFGERTQEDDYRFEALQSAEEALAAAPKPPQPVPSMTLTEEDARQQVDAAERVSRMYFDIAAEVLGEDEVRRRRDDYLEHDMERVRKESRISQQSQPVPEGWQLQQEHREALIVAPDGSGAWYDEESTKDRIVRELVGALLAAAPKPGGDS